jgi:hypothetical protein
MKRHYVVKSPITTYSLAAMQNIVAAELDALSFNPGVPVTVAPEP